MSFEEAAMGALLEFRDATETLRVALCASTEDAKLRVKLARPWKLFEVAASVVDSV